MKLVLGPTTNKEFVEDTFNMNIDMLKLKGSHLFIASHSWDTIEITLSENCDPDWLHYLHNVSENIITFIQPELSGTQNTMRCLCELYPDLSGTIRKYYVAKMDLTTISDKIMLKQ